MAKRDFTIQPGDRLKSMVAGMDGQKLPCVGSIMSGAVALSTKVNAATPLSRRWPDIQGSDDML